MSNPRLTITSDEAATLLDVDRRSVVRFVVRGELTPALKLPGRTGAYLFERADVEQLRAQRAGAAQ